MSSDSELSPAERYELTKLRILVEVQNDLSVWAKQRVWLLVAAIGLISFFGVGAFISASVGQVIEKRMEAVNSQIIAAIKSSIEAETSARQATKAAETEGRKINEAAVSLAANLEKISNGAAKTEEQLTRLSKTLDSRSENVRGESRLLSDALEKRIENLERALSKSTQANGSTFKADLDSSVAGLEAKAKRNQELFVQNSKYEIQVNFTDKHSALASKLSEILRNRGYQVAPYSRPDWSYIETVWGVKQDYVGSQITVLSPPSNDSIAKNVASVLQLEARVSGIKTGTDKRSMSPSHVGLLIPPSFAQ